jgi:hypothetical protein
MKLFKTLLAASLFLIPPGIGLAQEESKYQAYLVHEDQVKPSMTAEYEKISKELVSVCSEHDLQDAYWNAASTADGRYFYISPLENMADLDKKPMEPLKEKMGEEAFSNLFERFDECYDIHKNYVVILNKELSYTPDGLDMVTEGEDFRKWHFLNVSPKNKWAMAKKLKAVKDIYKSKNSKINYRVYQNGFGSEGDYFLVVVSAKDPLDYAQKTMENRALLGEAVKPALDAVFELASKYEEVVGSMRPELAFQPKMDQAITKNKK